MRFLDIDDEAYERIKDMIAGRESRELSYTL